MNSARTLLTSTNLPILAHLTSQIRSYAFKSDLKIKWVRPEKIPCYKPEKSGDLEVFQSEKADLSMPQPEFRNSKELATANETVKKLFSLEFAPRRKFINLYTEDVVSRVRRHAYDAGSIEVKIAKWTGAIRAFQEIMDRFPRDKIMKVQVKELIDRRKKHLKYLRRWDYKKFEWLLETLNLEFKPPPNEFRWVTRKESLVKLTNKYCEGIQNERLDAFKLVLESEQPIFLQEKIRSLEFIRNEQIECGAEVTVTEDEIAEVKKQYEELLQERKAKSDENQ